MSYIKKTVSINGTETEFMKTFIRELTAADERIVCESDDATINKATSNTPDSTPIYIKINNSCKIKIERPTVLNNTSYNFSAIINNRKYSEILINFINSGSLYSNDVSTRVYNFSVISNDNVIFVSIGAQNNNTIASSQFFILSVDYDNFTASGVSGAFSSLNTLYCTDEINTNTAISLFNRLPYNRTINDINIIDSKILVNNGTNTKFTEVFTGMIDCSYIASPNVITTEYGRYFVLNGYTLIPIVED